MRRGWFNDSHRHYLAAKGVKTKVEWRRKYPELVKDFPGDNPRLTEDSARFRQEETTSFYPSSFRTKRVAPGKSIVLGRNKKTGKYGLQSVIINKRYFADQTSVAPGQPRPSSLPPGVEAGMRLQDDDPVWRVVDVTPNPEFEVIEQVEKDGDELSKLSDFMPWNRRWDDD